MRKTYRGYQSFSYLTPDVDYRQFELACQTNRVAEYKVEVTDTQEQRVQNILTTSPVISLHEHPVRFPSDPSLSVEYVKEGRMFTGFEGLASSHLTCLFDNLMDGTAIITSKRGWKWADVIHDLGLRLSDIAHQDFVTVALTLDDILTAQRQDKVAFVFTLESATPIENELERIEILYGLGIRMMGITYNEANNLGSGAREPGDGGLTVFGREAVGMMNRLGMVIDVSHSSDQTCLDTIECSSDPIIISHAGARAVWDSRRMKPDEVFTACAAKGGLIGIEAAPHTTLSRQHPDHCIYSIMDHFTYLVELVGIDHVSFGPDTLYGDHVALHDAFRSHLSIGGVKGAQDHDMVPYVKGMENPTECFPNIVRWLVKHGYSDEDINKVIGGNAIRVLGEIWDR